MLYATVISKTDSSMKPKVFTCLTESKIKIIDYNDFNLLTVQQASILYSLY